MTREKPELLREEIRRLGVRRLNVYDAIMEKENLLSGITVALDIWHGKCGHVD
jgi:hypothetical protein